VQNIITTEDDLRSYIEQQLSCHDWNAIEEDYSEVMEKVHEQLRSEDHPDFGDDWSEWLGGIEVNAPWEWLAGEREKIAS